MSLYSILNTTSILYWYYIIIMVVLYDFNFTLIGRAYNFIFNNLLNNTE